MKLTLNSILFILTTILTTSCVTNYSHQKNVNIETNTTQKQSDSSQYCTHQAVSIVAKSYTSNQGGALIVGCYELKLKNGIIANDIICNSSNVAGILPNAHRYKPNRCKDNVELVHPKDIEAMRGIISHQINWKSSTKPCPGRGDVDSYSIKFNDRAVELGFTAECQ